VKDHSPIRSIANSLGLPWRDTYCSVLLSLLCAFLPSPNALNAAQSGDFTYEIAGSTITITGYTGPGGNVTIPGTLAGMPVISVGDNAFRHLTGLTSVSLPNGVTSIGDWAFEDCAGLTSVSLPDGVTSIGDWAFGDCAGLASVTIPNSVTSIGGVRVRVHWAEQCHHSQQRDQNWV
jgi:hypothetical protein